MIFALYLCASLMGTLVSVVGTWHSKSSIKLPVVISYFLDSSRMMKFSASGTNILLSSLRTKLANVSYLYLHNILVATTFQPDQSYYCDTRHIIYSQLHHNIFIALGFATMRFQYVPSISITTNMKKWSWRK